MTASLADSHTLGAAILAAVPLLYLAAALAQGRDSASRRARWRAASLAAAAAMISALLAVVWVAVNGATVFRGGALVSLGPVGEVGSTLRIDAVGATMLLLVTFIGYVITGYSRRYMDGDPGERRYVRWLMTTLAAVTLLVIANNLALLAIAWLGTSLALHQLLTHYDDRPFAMIAAHKKFIASRVADAALFGAIALVGHALGTLEIDRVVLAAQGMPQLPLELQAAAVLFAVSALLKCAQLPVHGWLIQVMEAPTPVSALLHAGVVNLGGFLLIRLAGLVGAAPSAQALLVIVGSLTAAIAALVMTTRISVKVMLAWSTCAQMGFMLMQCGLGAYELALLHLVAHSLYKAHAFLGAGGAVEQARLRQLSPARPLPGLGAWLAAAIGGCLAVAAAAGLLGIDPTVTPALWPLALVVALALAPLLAGLSLRRTGAWSIAFALGAFALATVYLGLHQAFARLVDVRPSGQGPQLWLLGWAAALFTLTFAIQSLVRARPDGATARRLHPWLYSGLYLDEIFTRLTFRLWPARLPRAESCAAPLACESASPGAR